jgi:hypothetical protein
MNDTELREQFHQWAAPLRATPPPDFTTIRRRTRRRVARQATLGSAALAAVGLVAALVVSVQSGIATPAQASGWASATYLAPPGQPYVFVNSFGAGPAELRDVATGSVVSVVRPIPPAVSFTAVAAVPNGRMFVLAEQGADGQLSFAELRVGGTSRGSSPTVRLTPILTGADVPASAQPENITVNAAATRLAIDTSLPDGSNNLIVYDLRDGSVIGSWPAFATPQFIGNGDKLVVDWLSGTRRQLASGHVRSSLRAVDTTHAFPAGSSFLADSLPAPGLHGISGGFTQDGSVSTNTVYGALGSVSTTGYSGATRLLEFSASSGRLLHAIPVGPAGALQGQYFCGVLWASPDGRDLLTQCGSRQQAVIDGRVRLVRLPWLFRPELQPGVTPFAW